MSVRAVSPGQPLRIPADVWNDVQRATRDYAETQRLGKVGARSARRPIPSSLVNLRNDSGADRREGEILQVGDFILDEVVPSLLWFAGVTPTHGSTAFPENQIAVLRHPTPKDDIEVAQVDGVCKALVNIRDLGHSWALPHDSHVLQSSDSGPVKILYRPNGTGEKECVVLLNSGPHTFMWGFVGSTAITAKVGDTPGSGTVTVRKLDPATGDFVNATKPDGTDKTIDVKNGWTTASGTDVDVTIWPDEDGIWWYLGEDCA